MVKLRPATHADDAWLGRWLPSVAKIAGYEPSSHDKAQKRLIIERNAVGSRSAGDPAGLMVFRPNAPERGDAIIELVATPPEQARHGAGMAAAALLEDELRGRGVRRIYAPAPAVHGIAMYFWIRLGYRPLLRGDWPCVRDGVAWLARDLFDVPTR